MSMVESEGEPLVTLEPASQGRVIMSIYEDSSDEEPIVMVQLSRDSARALGEAFAKYTRSDA